MHPLLTADVGKELLVLGNEAIVRGALAGSEVLPIPEEAFKETIRTKTKEKFVEVNLRAFDLGFGAL